MIMKNLIAVMGNLPILPTSFPSEMVENSGNMIHANAPIKIYKNAIYHHHVNINSYDCLNFSDFINKKCSHLIITMANTLKIGAIREEKFANLLKFIKKIEVPIVIFGLGVQSIDDNLESAVLSNDAIEALKFLSKQSKLLGVRGEFTKKVIEKNCGIDNLYVTGCPSLFSMKKDNYHLLKEKINNYSGVPAYSGTNYQREIELNELCNAIKKNYYLIEPANRFNYSFYLKCINESAKFDDIPYFLKKKIKDKTFNFEILKSFYERRLKLFRNIDDWIDFNKNVISYTYGTRFHVNMASVLSGVPALWLTHDSRTRELANFMCLPNCSIENFDSNKLEDYMSYDKFIENLPRLFSNFNHYVVENGLPSVESPLD